MTSRSGAKTENTPARSNIPFNTPDSKMSNSLVQVQSLAQSFLCTAACVTETQDILVQQICSAQHEQPLSNPAGQQVEEVEGVEIGEDALLRTDYGIYRV